MLVIGSELPVRVLVGEFEIVGAIMRPSDIDLVRDGRLAIATLAADHTHEILE